MSSSAESVSDRSPAKRSSSSVFAEADAEVSVPPSAKRLRVESLGVPSFIDNNPKSIESVEAIIHIPPLQKIKSDYWNGYVLTAALQKLRRVGEAIGISSELIFFLKNLLAKGFISSFKIAIEEDEEDTLVFPAYIKAVRAFDWGDEAIKDSVNIDIEKNGELQFDDTEANSVYHLYADTERKVLQISSVVEICN